MPVEILDNIVKPPISDDLKCGCLREFGLQDRPSDITRWCNFAQLIRKKMLNSRKVNNEL